jgi:hypothetical protein
MAARYYSMNTGLAPLNPQAVVEGTAAPTADVYVQVLTSGASGSITKMQVYMILTTIMQHILAIGVGTAYQTDRVPDAEI